MHMEVRVLHCGQLKSVVSIVHESLSMLCYGLSTDGRLCACLLCSAHAETDIR